MPRYQGGMENHSFEKLEREDERKEYEGYSARR